MAAENLGQRSSWTECVFEWSKWTESLTQWPKFLMGTWRTNISTVLCRRRAARFKKSVCIDMNDSRATATQEAQGTWSKQCDIHKVSEWRLAWQERYYHLRNLSAPSPHNSEVGYIILKGRIYTWFTWGHGIRSRGETAVWCGYQDQNTQCVRFVPPTCQPFYASLAINK